MKCQTQVKPAFSDLMSSYSSFLKECLSLGASSFSSSPLLSVEFFFFSCFDYLDCLDLCLCRLNVALLTSAYTASYRQRIYCLLDILSLAAGCK